jgi:hypothetical protein
MTKWVLCVCAAAVALTACYIPDMSLTDDERVEQGYSYRYAQWHPTVKESTAVVYEVVTQTLIAMDRKRSSDWTQHTPLTGLVASLEYLYVKGEFVVDENSGPLTEDYCYFESSTALGESSYHIPAMLDYWNENGYEYVTIPPSGEKQHSTYRALAGGHGELYITHFVDDDGSQIAHLAWTAGQDCQMGIYP